MECVHVWCEIEETHSKDQNTLLNYIHFCVFFLCVCVCVIFFLLVRYICNCAWFKSEKKNWIEDEFLFVCSVQFFIGATKLRRKRVPRSRRERERELCHRSATSEQKPDFLAAGAVQCKTYPFVPILFYCGILTHYFERLKYNMDGIMDQFDDLELQSTAEDVQADHGSSLQVWLCFVFWCMHVLNNLILRLICTLP